MDTPKNPKFRLCFQLYKAEIHYAHTVLGGSHLEGKTRVFSNKSKDWIPPTIPNSVFVFSFTKPKFTVLIRYLGGLIFKEKYMFFLVKKKTGFWDFLGRPVTFFKHVF